MKHGIVGLATVLVVALIVPSLTDIAAAQVTSTVGLMIDSRLKSADPAAVLRCDTDSVCQSPLLVSKGGKVQGQWQAGGCSVYWPYNQIKVAPSRKPTLRWVLVKDPSDNNTYVFHRSAGINLFSTDPNKLNDRRYDLDREQIEPDRQAFAWQNIHKLPASQQPGTPRTIAFVPVVYRKEPNGDLTQCWTADPDVVNEN